MMVIWIFFLISETPFFLAHPEFKNITSIPVTHLWINILEGIFSPLFMASKVDMTLDPEMKTNRDLDQTQPEIIM